MKSLGNVLSNWSIDDKDKYLSKEFQQYGIFLAESLDDIKHKALYIKMAKEKPRQILHDALSFVLDANANSKARLFMWKVKELLKSNSN